MLIKFKFLKKSETMVHIAPLITGAES